MFIRGKKLSQAETDLLKPVKMDEPTAKMEVDLHWCLGIFAMFVAILVLEFFSDMSRDKNLMLKFMSSQIINVGAYLEQSFESKLLTQV